MARYGWSAYSRAHSQGSHSLGRASRKSRGGCSRHVGVWGVHVGNIGLIAAGKSQRWACFEEKAGVAADLQGDSTWQHDSVVLRVLSSLDRGVWLAGQVLFQDMVRHTEKPFCCNFYTDIACLGQGKLSLLVGYAHVHHGCQEALVYLASRFPSL